MDFCWGRQRAPTALESAPLLHGDPNAAHHAHSFHPRTVTRVVDRIKALTLELLPIQVNLGESEMADETERGRIPGQRAAHVPRDNQVMLRIRSADHELSSHFLNRRHHFSNLEHFDQRRCRSVLKNCRGFSSLPPIRPP